MRHEQNSDYVIIYRGEIHHRITPGRWVLIQRAKEYGGGWWLGKAYDDVFMLEFERPTSMATATEYIMSHGRLSTFPPWDDEFELTP